MDTLFVPMKLTVLNVENDMSEEQIEQYNTITRRFHNVPIVRMQFLMQTSSLTIHSML